MDGENDPQSPSREIKNPTEVNLTPRNVSHNMEMSTPVSTTQDMVMETPTTPITPNITDFTEDEMDENEADMSNTSINTEKAFQVTRKAAEATPGPVKARRQLEENKLINSPSDAMLSPCTAMLMGRGGKKATNAAAAIIRKKQVGSIPFQLSEE